MKDLSGHHASEKSLVQAQQNVQRLTDPSRVSLSVSLPIMRLSLFFVGSLLLELNSVLWTGDGHP